MNASDTNASTRYVHNSPNTHSEVLAADRWSQKGGVPGDAGITAWNERHKRLFLTSNKGRSSAFQTTSNDEMLQGKQQTNLWILSTWGFRRWIFMNLWKYVFDSGSEMVNLQDHLHMSVNKQTIRPRRGMCFVSESSGPDSKNCFLFIPNRVIIISSIPVSRMRWKTATVIAPVPFCCIIVNRDTLDIIIRTMWTSTILITMHKQCSDFLWMKILLSLPRNLPSKQQTIVNSEAKDTMKIVKEFWHVSSA